MLVVFAAASFIGINYYHFPGSNHAITVPFIQSLLDPALFPGDELIAERIHFRTFFLDMIASLVRVTGLSIPTVFHVLYAISLLATFASFYHLALVIGERREVALFATALLMFGTPCLGGVATLENNLVERAMVLPIQLWALAMFWQGRVRSAFILTGFAFLLHPLSSTYCGFALLIAGCMSRSVSWSRLASGCTLLALIGAPLWLPMLLGDGPRLPFAADAGWLKIVMLRSAAHLDPSSWPLHILAGSVALAAGYFFLAGQLVGSARRISLGIGIGVVALCLAGVLFVHVLPLSLCVQMQPFRGFRFLVYVAYILYARHLLAAGAADWPRGLLARVPILVALALFFVGAGAQRYTFAGVMAMTLLCYPCWTTLRHRLDCSAQVLGAALILFALAAGVVGSFLSGGPWIGNAAAPAWRAVQEWAREETPADSAFIVPPDRKGFRLGSERRIYGDWKDGTQTFFNPRFGEAWLERMRRLGFDGRPERLRHRFRELTALDLDRIAQEMPRASRVFAVVDRRHTQLDLPVVFESAAFRVLRLR